jgi:mono/diheme cytochrome c family protein
MRKLASTDGSWTILRNIAIRSLVTGILVLLVCMLTACPAPPPPDNETNGTEATETTNGGENAEGTETGQLNGENGIETPGEETGEVTPAINELTWDKQIGAIFASKCTSCHGDAAAGGINLSTCELAISTGAITPGDVQTSKVMQKMTAGNHAASFTPQELTAVSQWILAGAPSGAAEETSSALAGTESPSETETPADETETVAAPAWDAVSAILTANCSQCHGATASGGMDITSYDTLMASGKVTAGDPDNSMIVNKIKGGDHFGKLSAEDLETLIQWIAAGANK